MTLTHDQSFKNLILDYPLASLTFFAAEEARRLHPSVRIIPIRQEQLKDRLSDRFFELDVPLLVEWPDGNRAALLFVLEEESDPRRFSIHRLGVYCLQLAEHFETERVVPVVIFLKSLPRLQTRLKLGGHRRRVMDFRPFVFMLGNLHSSEHLNSANIVTRITLPCMQHSSPSDQAEALGKAMEGLRTLEPDIEKRLKYYDFVRHYARLDETAQRLYAERYATEETHMNSIVEQIRAEGRQQGIAQGIEQGVKQGIRQGLDQGLLQGSQNTVARLIRLRFGDLDEATQARLKHATQLELDQWTERILTARTLDEVFQAQ